MNRHLYLPIALLMLVGCSNKEVEGPIQISGIYPALAYYNDEGECGTGAVVPWGDRLWVVTYGPHLPFGSSDKLYEITPELRQIVHDESIGGTPANRMVHRESNQLFIGPYAIDTMGNVRTIPYNIMPGRHTANARALVNPESKILYATMEEGFYAVDVKTLKVDTIYIDGNCIQKRAGEMAQHNDLLPGAHGKGFYSGQGVAVFSNNGEASEEALEHFDAISGALCEWDGKDWKVVRRNQFVEVTGPGGIYGNPNPDTDPIWATGWDHKSVLLGVRDANKGWSFYRLPKASHSYDGAHGWNTEWPRIRNIGTDNNPEYLMTMHGMFWFFPENFTADKAVGIRPRSAYLKVIGDFARWNDRLVFGCDDSAQKEFLNKRKVKGNLPGPGQSNSNLWFTALDKPWTLGPATVEGAVWEKESVKAGIASEPYLFAGWDHRSVWLSNGSNRDAQYKFEIDSIGNGKDWSCLMTVKVPANSSKFVPFDSSEVGEWIRIVPQQDGIATASFTYTKFDDRNTTPHPIFAGLAQKQSKKISKGLLYCLGNNRRALGLLATKVDKGQETPVGYYEMDDSLRLIKKYDPEITEYIAENFAIPKQAINIEQASVLIIDDRGRRWRLPLNDDAFIQPTKDGELRLCREVATERDLFSCMGTFYELPAENADGFAKIRPIASHPFHINDYASYRGMLIMTGIDFDNIGNNKHIIKSDDKQVAVWAGAIDDLWELGKPTGQGGPWKDSPIIKGNPSDPYLFGFYDHRTLQLSHQASSPVTFTIEMDPTGNGDWMVYDNIKLNPGKIHTMHFDPSVQARWIRFISDTDTKATALLTYK